MKFLAVIIAFLLCTGLQASTTKLSQAVDLPIVIEGKAVGSMKLPVGSEVEVVSVSGINAVIKRGDSTYTIASSSLGTSTAVVEAVATASRSATTTPFQASAPIDKTLNPSTTVPFFIPNGEHSLSDIDASRLKDDLPGSHGWLTVKNGHLYNGEKRLRLVGVNTTDVTDEEIAEMKKYGFNSLRLWVAGLTKNPQEKVKQIEEMVQGGHIDPENLAMMDKRISKCISAGFWIDLNVIERPVPGQLDDRTRDLHKAFLKSLLTHVNPYTGKAYREDPAIFAIELANEHGVESVLNGTHVEVPLFNPNTYKKQITEKWNRWLADKYKTQESLNAAWPNNKEILGSVEWLPGKTDYIEKKVERRISVTYVLPPRDPTTPEAKEKDWMDFAISVGASYNRDLVDYIHRELHYQGLVMTGCEEVLPSIRNLGDATFEHAYTTTGSSEKGHRFTKASYHHVAGKPYFLNEHNIYYPNPHIGEAALSALSAAAAQDWDGVFLFNWNGSFSESLHTKIAGSDKMIKSSLPVCQNPALMASLPTAINLFIRGDLNPLKATFVNTVNGVDVLNDSNAEKEMVNKTSWSLKNLDRTFKERTTLAFADNPTTTTTTEEKPVGGYSDQNTCHLDGETLFIDTPKTVLCIGTSTNIPLSHAKFEIGKTEIGWGCFSATSLDNADLKDSKEILVTLIGKTGNTGGQVTQDSWILGNYTSAKENPGLQKQLIEEWGTAPVITECISANVFIPVDTSKGRFKAYSLDEKAQKKAEIPQEITPEGITLHTTGKEGTIWYEIVRS